LSLEEKRAARIGLARVDREVCLLYAGRGACQLCVDECRMAGYDAIEFMRVGGAVDGKGAPVEGSRCLAPVVREDRCIGCGLCQMRCHAINVEVRKRLPCSAIRVVAGEGREDRLLAGRTLLSGSSVPGGDRMRKKRAARRIMPGASTCPTF